MDGSVRDPLSRLDRGRLALWLPVVAARVSGGACGRRVGQGVGAGDARLRGGNSVFYALGNAGQVILVNPAEDTVVVKWAIWGAPSQFEERRRQDGAFFAALFEALISTP